MIPRTLQIKNFLSYGAESQLISFDDHALICLSGNNGHGKSALLDAMTWAVWGAARKIQNSVRADQGLLRLGTTTMLVIFDCSINNTIYRIKREFELIYGKPKMTLDIGILNPDGTIRPLTEKTVRDTQAKIESIIGLDYETFANSSFLRQGNANEFSKRSPKERKEIIGAILGLNLYETLKKTALEKSRVAAQEAETIRTLITHTTTEHDAVTALLNYYPAFCAALAQSNEQIESVKKTIQQLHAALVQQETEKQALNTKMHSFEMQEAAYNQQLAMLKQLVMLWRTTRARQLDIDQKQKTEEQLKQLETRLLAAHKQYDEYRILKEQLQKDELEKAHVAQALAIAIARFKAEQKIIAERIASTHQHLQEQQKMLATEKKRLETENAMLSTAQGHEAQLIAQLTSNTASLEQLQKTFDKRKDAYQRWTTLGNIIREEHGTQLQRLELAHDTTNPSCPLCEQSLSAARKRFLQTKIEGQIHTQAQRLARLKRLLPRLKEVLITDHALLQQRTQQKTELHTLQHAQTQKAERIAQLNAGLHQITTKQDTLAQQLLETAQQKNTMALQFAAEPTTPEIEQLRRALTQRETTIAATGTELLALAYDPRTIPALQQQMATLKTTLDQYTQHTHALLMQSERKQQILQRCAQLKADKKFKTDRDITAQQLQQYGTVLAELRHKETTAQQHAKELQRQHEQLLIEQGSFNAAQTTQKMLVKKLEELEKKCTISSEIVADYHAIATALGKDGIQALLIEEAIPEIEDYANALLAKLTNNSAHIMIESLRDLKSGGTKETLDIKISDIQGVRPYEMFSGGEAFRIDIALRIAISKLLAHRAGTALQTLIIDEGFGSQDEEGLNALIDVLHTLRDEFAKIIVVSHLPIMKDQFPVHFHVEKNAQGSTVRIIEQG